MEQTRYWMWTKRKHDFGTHVFAPYGDSWEEQAFAEDAAGALGGSCVWPPRSYTCTFCRREFKSAQALGGHMNVHRRDRARLKQSPNPQNCADDVLPHSQITQFPPPLICGSTLLCDHSSKSSDHQGRFMSPSSPVRVSSSSSSPPAKVVQGLGLEEKLLKQPNPPFLFSSILSEDDLNRRNVSPPQNSWSNLTADKCFHVSDLTPIRDNNFKTSQSNSNIGGRANEDGEKEEYGKADLFGSTLNLFFCRTTRSNVSTPDADEDLFLSCNKRRKIDHETSSNDHFLLTKSSPVERCKILPQSGVPNKLMSPNPVGDLDLELRLGDPPKV